MSKLTGIALKRAQLVPSAMFASPAAVVRSKALSLPQKIAILRRWEFDVRQRSGASRALTAGAGIGLLEEVRAALADLGAPAGPARDPTPACRHALRSLPRACADRRRAQRGPRVVAP